MFGPAALARDFAPAVAEALARLAEAAGAPPDQTRGLPPALYTEQEILRLEEERIFAREWHCAGLAAELPKAGDYLTFAIGRQPIFIMRGEDGGMRAFANVCRHRMATLLTGQGNCGRIICPYHAWTYDLNGRLVAAAHMERTPGFDKSAVRLAEIRCETWEGWVYVSLDPAIESIATRLAPLRELVARYRMAGYVPVARQDLLWRTNWKLLVENFMEGYHLPVLHRRTVGAWFPADETKFFDRVHDGFTGQTFVKSEDAIYGRAHAANNVLTGHWRYTSVMPTVYPAHMYVLAPDHFWYLSLQPENVGQLRVRFGLALAPEVLAAMVDRQRDIDDMVGFFDRVNDEDRAIVEGLFRNAQSPLASQNRQSWLEREIHHFQGYLARRLCGADARPRAAAQ